MTEDQSSAVDWDDWQVASEPEAVEGDWSDASPVCPRCLNELSRLDHYCGECEFAVGQFTPCIPYVNIRFMCEPFCIMWERMWNARGETIQRRVLYAGLLLLAGLVSGYAWILVVGLVIWYWKTPIPPGQCQSCGYDLRGGNDRCPECGTPCAAV